MNKATFSAQGVEVNAHRLAPRCPSLRMTKFTSQEHHLVANRWGACAEATRCSPLARFPMGPNGQLASRLAQPMGCLPPSLLRAPRGLRAAFKVWAEAPPHSVSGYVPEGSSALICAGPGRTCNACGGHRVGGKRTSDAHVVLGTVS